MSHTCWVKFSFPVFSNSLSQIPGKTKWEQIKSTPLPGDYLNCWAIHSHTWRWGRSKRKRSRNLYLAALENFPKWQTAVKVRLREAQYKPDKFSVSTEHQMAGAVPHHLWSKSSLLQETNELRWYQSKLLHRISSPALWSTPFGYWLAILPKQMHMTVE